MRRKSKARTPNTVRAEITGVKNPSAAAVKPSGKEQETVNHLAAVAVAGLQLT